ncbi:MAG: CPBP family intramembrane metalloprotease [Sedimentisphaerales bacterium]|nr:CPBP family intramembrane metalloprotease [Sedimentisphaerales bacterium]
MEDKIKFTTSQLFNFQRDSYLERTSRPIYALIFLLPFIIFYEIGTIFINTNILDQSQVRVIAFVWLQKGLEYIGLGGKFAWIFPPFVVVIILILLQATSRRGWRFLASDILPMAVECILFALPLIVLSIVLNSSSPAAAALQAGPVQRSVLADIVTGIGAGIYEELVFRLVLICLLMIIFQDLLRISHSNSIIMAVLVSAALFSAHHHIVFIDGQFRLVESFSLGVFFFRTIAGVYFASLFAVRGFGITAGAHSFYDIIATLINVLFFSGQ